MKTHFILYVENQPSSARFYEAILERKPTLDVPGMTEFELGPDTILGLMPNAGVRRLFKGAVTPGRTAAELYLHVADPKAAFDRAVAAGANPLQPPEPRDWGDEAAYVEDADGHVIAFARKQR